MVKSTKKTRHFTIPLFIPHAACPFQCIFCDQRSITGSMKIPDCREISEIIERNLSTLPSDAIVEAGFFGGTFTGLPQKLQRGYLNMVMPYVENGLISSIRISTRPDYIDEKALSLLSEYPIKTIELGVQSFDDDVLLNSERGHTSSDSIAASELIISKGFSLGLQMMTGLPGDSSEKVVRTAREIVRLGAREARIYPVIVIKGTKLEEMFYAGKYKPLELEEAVKMTKAAIEVFEQSEVKVIRVGLHHSDFLMQNGYIAGPVHVSFRELVMTEIWNDRLSEIKNNDPEISVTIRVNPEEINNATGYHGKNKKMLKKIFKNVRFITDPSIQLKTFYADYC